MFVAQDNTDSGDTIPIGPATNQILHPRGAVANAVEYPAGVLVFFLRVLLYGAE